MGSLAAVAVAASSLAVGCRNDPAAGTAAGEDRAATRQVRVAPTRVGTLPRVVTVSGTLAAEDQVALGMKVAGRLSEIAVDLGSRVARGQALARLVSTDFELRVSQAQAALQQARSRLGLAPGAADDVVDPDETPLVRQARAVLNEARLGLDRVHRLMDDQLVSRAQVDAAEAAFAVAEGRYQDAQEEILNRQAVLAQRRTELELARQQLTDSVLHAPFEGAVRERHASPGQFVAAGEPVVTLVRVHPLRLRLAVPERDSAGLRAGQEVRLTVEGDERPRTGRVARLSPAITETSRTLMVEAEVPNPDGALRPGAFASAQIVTTADQPVILVPASSIITFAGIEKVLVVVDGKTVEKRVRTGRRAESQVEILEGLEAGEDVVVEPGDLAGGQAVAVVD
jgi:RND family efflux transporter MFP subunit